MTTEPRPLYRQRWLIIYNALVERGLAEDIARHCGVSKATVHAVISSYNRLGVTAVETPGKGGRRSGYLSLAEERAFLAPFFGRAEKGELATTQETGAPLKRAWGTRSTIAPSTACSIGMAGARLLPRPRHPKADPQAQQQFKKTMQRRFKQQLRRGIPTLSDRS